MKRFYFFSLGGIWYVNLIFVCKILCLKNLVKNVCFPLLLLWTESRFMLLFSIVSVVVRIDDTSKSCMLN